MGSALGVLGLVALVLASNVTGAQVSDPAADFARLTGTWQIDASGSTSLSSERRVITVSRVAADRDPTRGR